jgi:hypothetical protein
MAVIRGARPSGTSVLVRPDLDEVEQAETGLPRC